MIYPKTEIVKALMNYCGVTSGLTLYTIAREDITLPYIYVDNIEFNDISVKTGDMIDADITLHVIYKGITDFAALWSNAKKIAEGLNKLGTLSAYANMGLSYTSIKTELVGTSQAEREINGITYNYEIIRFIETITKN